MTKKQFNILSGCYFGTLMLFYFAVLWINDFESPIEILIFGYPLGFVIFVSVLISIPPLIILGIYVKRVRTKKLKAIANAKGWSYEYLDLPILKVLLKKLKLTLSLHSLQTAYKYGIIGKIKGWNFTIFDGELYQTEGSNKVETFFVLKAKDMDLPLFRLEQKTFGRKLINLVKERHINFGSVSKFSKMYQLYGENESDLRQLFKDEIQDFFEKQEDPTVIAHKDNLVMYQDGKLCEIGQLEAKLNLLVEIAKVLIKNNKFEVQTIKKKMIP